jgi:hypothetical protein
VHLALLCYQLGACCNKAKLWLKHLQRCYFNPGSKPQSSCLLLSPHMLQTCEPRGCRLAALYSLSAGRWSSQ